MSFPSLISTTVRLAQHHVSYMAKYLGQEYTPHIYDKFSTPTVAIAESMEWDHKLNKPIAANESLCSDIENTTFSWEIQAPSGIALASQPLWTLTT